MNKIKYKLWTIVVLTTVACAFRSFDFIHNYSVNLLMSDQWDFLTPVFQGDSLWAQFNWQHGPHRMGVGLWFTAWVLNLSHWNVNILAYSTLVILCACVPLATVIPGIIRDSM